MRVQVRHKTNGNGRVIPTKAIIQEVSTVYSANRIKTSSGDIWEVVPFRSAKGTKENESPFESLPKFMTVR